MASLYSIDFNSGASLASLGFTHIDPTVANVAGVGLGGSYAMSWQSGDDLTRCRYPFDMGTELDACFSGVWIPKVYTDFSLFSVLYFNGVSFDTIVQLYTDSGTRELFLQQQFLDEVWRSSANFFTIDTPLYWRLYVKGSSVYGTFDGEITLWTGPSTTALTQQFASTAALVSPGPWNYAGFGPMGVLDNVAGATGTCGAAGGGGEADRCCVTATTPGGGVTDPDGTPEPVGPRDNTTIGPFVYTPTICGGFLAAATDPTDPQELT